MTLLTQIVRQHGGPYKPLKEAPPLDDIATQIGMHPKRAIGIGEKWSRKGWWDYGVTVRFGWLTPTGYTEAVRQGYNERSST